MVSATECKKEKEKKMTKVSMYVILKNYKRDKKK
jgi:hypothetical protein